MGWAWITHVPPRALAMLLALVICMVIGLLISLVEWVASKM
jgi:hypothetical protein